MKLIRCPLCSGDYTSAGIRGHLRFKHSVTDLSTIPALVEIEQQPQNITPQTSSSRVSSISALDTLEARRLELEIKRTETEIERLNKPDTKIDYYDKMLDITKEHNKQIVDMLKSEQDLKIQIAKLELESGEGGDFTDLIIDKLLPMLPDMLAKRNEIKTPVPPSKTETPQIQKMDTSKVPPTYITDIKSGKITEEQAFKDLKKAIKLGFAPEGTKLPTKVEFHEQYLNVKNSKD